MCGKDCPVGLSCRAVLGSPPRVRERRYDLVQAATVARITPACAGKTLPPIIGIVSSRDHPRVCGKDMILTATRNATAGSPPRVRERRPKYKRACLCAGITPACAGKTIIPAFILLHRRDHPRVCGKDFLYAFRSHSPLGSPPRVRERPAC